MRDYTKVRIFQLQSAQTGAWARWGLTLFCNIVTMRAIGIVVSTPEELAQHWVVAIEVLETADEVEVQADIRFLHSFWLDVPTR